MSEYQELWDHLSGLGFTPYLTTFWTVKAMRRGQTYTFNSVGFGVWKELNEVHAKEILYTERLLDATFGNPSGGK